MLFVLKMSRDNSVTFNVNSVVAALWPVNASITYLVREDVVSRIHWFKKFTSRNLVLPLGKTGNAKLKGAKYEIQKPPTCRATLFRCKFSSMFPIFHLA